MAWMGSALLYVVRNKKTKKKKENKTLLVEPPEVDQKCFVFISFFPICTNHIKGKENIRKRKKGKKGKSRNLATPSEFKYIMVNKEPNLNKDTDIYSEYRLRDL